MKKIVQPAICEVYKGTAKAYAEITFMDGNLSIHGVIGPLSNGNCKGSAGQCSDSIREGTPAKGWTREMLDRFCDIWDEWHLNDMRPYCEHQKTLGWDELASEKVTLYHYSLTNEAFRLKREAEGAATKALKDGVTFTPSVEQQKYAALAYGITLPHKISGEMVQYYEPKKSLYPGSQGATEIKLLGLLKPEEHPDGLLCRPCPVCGYKYGTSWKKEEVPQEIIDWLFALPDSDTEPAWV